jgi:hypothetical protein
MLVVLSPDPEGGLDTLRKLQHESPAPLLSVAPALAPELILRARCDGADHSTRSSGGS